jgi:hypothetical protein
MRFSTLCVMCFSCLLPFNVHKDLPIPRPNNLFVCLYDDYIRPIAYLVYLHKPICKLIFAAIGLHANQFMNLQGYTAWLSRGEPNNNALPNILEVIIAYMNLKLMGHLPSESFCAVIVCYLLIFRCDVRVLITHLALLYYKVVM